jgi:hypothetical protein
MLEPDQRDDARLPPVHYHESFWVTAGAAAPVIALAAIVALIDTLQSLVNLSNPSHPFRDRVPSYASLWMGVITGMGNIALQAFVLLFALASLAHEHDAVPPLAAAICPFAGVCLVGVGSMMAAILRYRLLSAGWHSREAPD